MGIDYSLCEDEADCGVKDQYTASSMTALSQTAEQTGKKKMQLAELMLSHKPRKDIVHFMNK